MHQEWSPKENERVHAWFYTEWHTATVRRVFHKADGPHPGLHAEVLWDSEYSTSELPTWWLVAEKRASMALPPSEPTPSNVETEAPRPQSDHPATGGPVLLAPSGKPFAPPPGLEGMNQTWNLLESPKDSDQGGHMEPDVSSTQAEPIELKKPQTCSSRAPPKGHVANVPPVPPPSVPPTIEVARPLRKRAEGPSDPELRAFVKNWSLSESSRKFLKGLPGFVQQEVVHNFRPGTTVGIDPILHTFARRIWDAKCDTVDLESFVENWSESPAAVIKHGPGVGKSSKELLSFSHRYHVKGVALQTLKSLPTEQMKQVLSEFEPKSGPRDVDKALLSYINNLGKSQPKPQQSQPQPQPQKARREETKTPKTPKTPITTPSKAPEVQMVPKADSRATSKVSACLLSSRDQTSGKAGYMFYVEPDGLWSFWVGTGKSWAKLYGSTAVLGKWTHLRGTMDVQSKEARLYVDHQLAARGWASYVPNTRQALRLGAGKSEAEAKFFFTGDLRDVAVIGRLVSNEDLTDEMLKLAKVRGPQVGPDLDQLPKLLRQEKGRGLQNASGALASALRWATGVLVPANAEDFRRSSLRLMECSPTAQGMRLLFLSFSIGAVLAAQGDELHMTFGGSGLRYWAVILQSGDCFKILYDVEGVSSLQEALSRQQKLRADAWLTRKDVAMWLGALDTLAFGLSEDELEDALLTVFLFGFWASKTLTPQVRIKRFEGQSRSSQVQAALVEDVPSEASGKLLQTLTEEAQK